MIFLARGQHDRAEQGLCAMEWCAWAAGEMHSDYPRCVSPTIGSVLRSLNDHLSDETRQSLIPVLLDCIGTHTSRNDEWSRRLLLLQWVTFPVYTIHSLDTLHRLEEDLRVYLARAADTSSFRAGYFRWLCSVVMAMRDGNWDYAGNRAAAGVGSYKTVLEALDLIRAMAAVGRVAIPMETDRVQVLQEAV